MEMVKRGFKAWLDSTWVFWTLVACTAAFFAPTIDGYLRPAVTDFAVNPDKSYMTNGHYIGLDGKAHPVDLIVLHGNFDKKRCTFVAVNGVGYSNARGEVPVGVNFQDDRAGSQTRNRPTGPQQFGPWRITMEPPSDVWGFQLQAAHTCGYWPFQWTIYTKLGPIVAATSLKYLPSGGDRS